MAEMYRKEIESLHPGLIVFVLDDSGSMDEPLRGAKDKKHAWVESYVGALLEELLHRSTVPGAGGAVRIKSRYFVHTIVYGSGASVWKPQIAQPLSIEQMVTEYGQDNSSLGLGGKAGGTNAKAAFAEAYRFLQGAINDPRFAESFPPMVFHLTDGASATDATAEADSIRQLATTDGNVLVLNAFIDVATRLSYTSPKDFPGYMDVQDAGPDSDSERLFHMSSVMPDTLHTNLAKPDIFPQIRAGARLYFDVRTETMLRYVLQVVGSMGSRNVR